MGSRQRPLQTCAVSLLEIAHKAYVTASRNFNGSASLPSPSCWTILCALQCHLLAILGFLDDWILTWESLAETVFPPSKRLFDRIDELVKDAESLPSKFDDAIEKLPGLVHQVPLLHWALARSISCLEFLLAVLNNLGMKVKEKEINVVDVSSRKRSGIPDDRETRTVSEKKNGVIPDSTDQELTSNDAEKVEHALTSNGKPKIVTLRAKVNGIDNQESTELGNDDQIFASNESTNEREAFMGSNEATTVSDIDSSNANEQTDEERIEQDADHQTFEPNNEVVIAMENGDPELTRKESGAAPEIADEQSGCKEITNREPLLMKKVVVIAQENGNHQLTWNEPGAIADEERETAEITEENDNHQLPMNEPEAAVGETDPAIPNEQSESNHHQTFKPINEPEGEVPETDPSVTSSAIVSETEETMMESDCSSTQMKSDRETSLFPKDPETRTGIPGAGNLVAWSNVVKGTYKDVLVKLGTEVNPQKGSGKGKRHVKKVVVKSNAEVGKEEGKGRKKGRRKKGSNLQLPGFVNI